MNTYPRTIEAWSRCSECGKESETTSNTPGCSLCPHCGAAAEAVDCLPPLLADLYGDEYLGHFITAEREILAPELVFKSDCLVMRVRQAGDDGYEVQMYTLSFPLYTVYIPTMIDFINFLDHAFNLTLF